MREIQDLTLQIERGLAAIEKLFEKRKNLFTESVARYSAENEHAFGIRVTLAPLSPIYMERVHNVEEVRPKLKSFYRSVGETPPHELIVPKPGMNWRPIARGTTCDGDDESFLVSRQLHCDGLIEYTLLHRKSDSYPFRLHPEWVMGIVANSLCACECFRRVAASPATEYGLELEILVASAELDICRYGTSGFGFKLGPLPKGQTIFPRYSVGSTTEFQQVCQALERDFWHAAGHDMRDLAVIDFQPGLPPV